MNQIETEAAARIFIDNGFAVTLTPLTAATPPDWEIVLCVVNTCAVTQKAEQKGRRMIRLLLEKCPSAAIIVTGCYAQLSAAAISAIDRRIAVLPGQLKSRLLTIAAQLQKLNGKSDFNAERFIFQLQETVLSAPPAKIGFSENSFILSTDSFVAHSRASLKIQDGCNAACSYCTIHIARGHSVSLDAATVIERIQQLERSGHTEVVFAAINIGQYRSMIEGKQIGFTELLERCLTSTAKINFRISSLYPETIDDHFCTVVKNKRIRPYFHISVQSGSDRILTAMGRHYTHADIIKACKKLNTMKAFPFISADIITGFPAETEDDFNATMQLCKECRFAWVHVFPFSMRPGTPAARMKPLIPQSVSAARAARLNAWAAESKMRYIQNCIGKTFNAVLESARNSPVFIQNTGRKIYRAVTENFLHCEIDADQLPFQAGDEIKLEIKGFSEQRIKKGGEYDTIAVFTENIE